jgi:hypothetical protein
MFIMHVEKEGNFRKLTWHPSGVNGSPVNHLLFPDDSLMFLAANTQGAYAIMEVLEKYSRASGHKVNLDKSSVHFSKPGQR